MLGTRVFSTICAVSYCSFGQGRFVEELLADEPTAAVGAFASTCYIHHDDSMLRHEVLLWILEDV